MLALGACSGTARAPEQTAQAQTTQSTTQTAQAAPAAQSGPPSLVQWSPFIALQNGVYGGFVTVAQVRGSGDVGLGAAARLNGEMLMLGDTFFQFLASGRTVRAPDTLHLAFALAGRSSGAARVTLPAPVAFPFPATVDAALPTVNWFYTVHAHATFTCLVARTFPPQAVDTPIAYVKPRVDTLRNVTGTVAGFHEPPFVSLTSVPGYHLHFIDDAHVRGGHVLAFRTAQPLVLSYAPLGGLQLLTPSSAEYRRADLSKPRGPSGPSAGCP